MAVLTRIGLSFLNRDLFSVIGKKGTIILFLSFLIYTGQSQNCVWARNGDGPNGSYGSSVCADLNGNVYFTGTFQGSFIAFGSYTLTNTGFGNIFLVKCNSAGNVIWAISTQGNGNDFSYSVCSDKLGNIYLAGYFASSFFTIGSYTFSNSGVSDAFLAKIDPSGNVLWAKTFGSDSNENIYSLATDSNNNVFAAAYSTSSIVTVGSNTISSPPYAMLLIKYNGTDGNVIWVKSAIGNGTPYAVTVDKSDNVYFTGEFYSSSISIDTITLNRTDNDEDFFLLKLDNSGNVLWGRSGSNRYAYSVCTNTNEDAFILGTFYSSALTIGSYSIQNQQTNGNTDNFIAKYDKNGNLKWAKGFGGLGNDFAYSIASDASAIYITGYFSPAQAMYIDNYTLTSVWGDIDPMYFIRLDFSGQVVYGSKYRSGGGGGNNQNSVCTDNFGNVYVCSDFSSSPFVIGTHSLTSSGSRNPFLAKFNFPDVGIEENAHSFSKSILYPNPNAGLFTLSFSQEKSEQKIEISIFDITGKLIVNEEDNISKDQELKLKNDLDNGLYLVRIKFEDGTNDVHRLIISK